MEQNNGIRERNFLFQLCIIALSPLSYLKF